MIRFGGGGGMKRRISQIISMLYLWLCFHYYFVIALQMPPPRCSSSSSHTSSFGAKQNHPTTYNGSPAYLGPIVLSENNSKGTSENHIRIRNWYQQLLLLQQQRNNGDDDDDHHYDYEFINDLLAMPKVEEPNNNNNNKDSSNVCGPKIKAGSSSSSKSILTKIVHHFVRMDAPVDVKEVCESVEFVLRMRKRVVGNVIKLKKQRRKQQQQLPNQKNDSSSSIIHLQDLCCGHGLTGMLFAACYGSPTANNNQVHVTLVDQTQPSSHTVLKDLIVQVCPWVQDRIKYQASSLDEWKTSSAENDIDDEIIHTTKPNIIIATHACGMLTDYVINYAMEQKAESIAVMPCCYTGTDVGSPYGIKRALGVSWAADIRRSYKLQECGYHVDFGAIPQSITPMNRIIVGELR